MLGWTMKTLSAREYTSEKLMRRVHIKENHKLVIHVCMLWYNLSKEAWGGEVSAN